MNTITKLQTKDGLLKTLYLVSEKTRYHFKTPVIVSSVFRNKDINDRFHVIEIAYAHNIEISSITMAYIAFYKPINELYVRILLFYNFLRWCK